MSYTIPTEVPKALVAGDTWEWEKDFSDYPASEGYTLKYRLIQNNSVGDVIDITSTPDGDKHLVSVDSNESASYEAGNYRIIEYVEGTDNSRHTLSMGSIDVWPNPDVATDIRSYYQKIVDAIDAILAGKISEDVKSYTIKGRTLISRDFEELRLMRAVYASLVLQEKAKMESATTNKRKGIYVEFS